MYKDSSISILNYEKKTNNKNREGNIKPKFIVL